VGVHLSHESEALHDAMIQIYEFSFGQMIYVDAIHVGSPRSTRCPALCRLTGPASDSRTTTCRQGRILARFFPGKAGLYAQNRNGRNGRSILLPLRRITGAWFQRTTQTATRAATERRIRDRRS
jgi:hypothetical protein